MLIVLEGLDGAGKSTQVRMFREYLESMSPNVRYIHFPRYDAPVYGGLISRFLRGDFGANGCVHPQLVALLFAEDRRTAAGSIREALDAGGTVLLDRYVYSNIAYQCAKLPDAREAEELRRWIIDTEYGSFGLPRPDLNIFLDVPISFVRQSLGKHRNGTDRDYLHGGQDIHESDIDFQIRVRDMYRRQASEDGSFIPIDCGDAEGRMLPPETIFSKVKECYENHKKN
ncbi:MAG TPA: thymidylate kinase [Candidatus Cryptobacteroides merdipullorum]|uniref:Thymidylate kinase n=1 Tax=Candidatus Cryptobacteroides merdipullorum TaxID=2840771 RepID=A0A9D1GMB3_9BACT|nr:thymidylate kinase [Candidatus Cryptobacteroides merdipullorum]